MNTRVETSKTLRLFLDKILALQAANDADEDAIELVLRDLCAGVWTGVFICDSLS